MTPTDLTALMLEARQHAASMREVQACYPNDKPIPANHLWVANTARIIEGLADSLAALAGAETPPQRDPETMTDAEIDAELRAQGRDPAEVAQQGRGLIKRTVAAYQQRAAVAPPALVAPSTEDALRAVWGQIVLRWNGMITAKLNYPTSGDLITVMGHVNDAFREALALPLPDASPDAAPAPEGPTDAEVNEAIDALAERAKRTVTGISGHAWGARAKVDASAALLKRALAPPAAAPPQGTDERA